MPIQLGRRRSPDFLHVAERRINQVKVSSTVRVMNCLGLSSLGAYVEATAAFERLV
jgi:hypothetical protein